MSKPALPKGGAVLNGADTSPTLLSRERSLSGPETASKLSMEDVVDQAADPIGDVIKPRPAGSKYLPKDMWNQSLLLPSEFVSPSQVKSAHDEHDDDFPINLKPSGGVKNPNSDALLQPSTKSGSKEPPMPNTTDAFKIDHEIADVSLTSYHHMFRYMQTRFTWAVLLRLVAVAIGIIFCVIAVLLRDGTLYSSPSATTVPLWRWMGFIAICVWCYPLSRIIVRIAELGLWYAKPPWTTTAYYYLQCSRTHMAIVLISMGWLIGFNILITSAVPSFDTDSAYFYGTEAFWLIFIAALLIFAARLAKELSASYFEKTTFWTLVSETLKKEYFIFACCPGTPVPSPVVLTYHRAGEEATRSDPRVVRQCTKYVRREVVIAYDNVHPGSLVHPLANVSAPIEIASSHEVQDLAEVIFDHVWQTLYGGDAAVIGEDTSRTRLRALKHARGSEPEPAVRTMFTVGHNLLRRDIDDSLHSGNRSSMSRFAAKIGEERTGPAVVIDPVATVGPKPDNPAELDVKPQLRERLPSEGFGMDDGFQQRKNDSIANHPGHVSGRKIYQKDFEAHMFASKDSRGLDPNQVWTTLFDPIGRGHSTRKLLRNTLMRFFNDRLGLGHTLKDSQTAVDRLGTVYYSVAFVGIVVAACLLFAGPASYNVWIGITSLFVTLAVVFGNSLRIMCENIVYIFFRHPFDVGDLVLYNDNFYSVRKLELLSTTLIVSSRGADRLRMTTNVSRQQKWNGQYLQLNNETLAQSHLYNLTRSGLYWEFLEAHVDTAVATEQFLNNVRQYMGDFIKINPERYSGKFQVIVKAIERPLVLRINAYIEFAYSPVNLTRLFEDIGMINECFAGALRKYSATVAGVGVGAVRAQGDANVPHLVCASGLFGRAKAISEAVGLSPSISPVQPPKSSISLPNTKGDA